MTHEKQRWQYRFDNYKRAYFLLQGSVDQKRESGLNQLEKEGVIQRFEYSMELAWKTMRDYLESQNVVFDEATPRTVIKEAFASKLITNGEIWLEALDARNKMSHTYNFKDFEAVIIDIEKNYLSHFSDLYEKLALINQDLMNA